jgi:hypothetical protein
MCNLVGSVLQTFPCFGSLSRSVVNDAAGARTHVAGLITGGTVLLTILLLLPLFAYLPQVALAAIIGTFSHCKYHSPVASKCCIRIAGGIRYYLPVESESEKRTGTAVCYFHCDSDIWSGARHRLGNHHVSIDCNQARSDASHRYCNFNQHSFDLRYL